MGGVGVWPVPREDWGEGSRSARWRTARGQPACSTSVLWAPSWRPMGAPMRSSSASSPSRPWARPPCGAAGPWSVVPWRAWPQSCNGPIPGWSKPCLAVGSAIRWAWQLGSIKTPWRRGFGIALVLALPSWARSPGTPRWAIPSRGCFAWRPSGQRSTGWASTTPVPRRSSAPWSASAWRPRASGRRCLASTSANPRSPALISPPTTTPHRLSSWPLWLITR